MIVSHLPLSQWYFYRHKDEEDQLRSLVHQMVCLSRVPVGTYPSDFLLAQDNYTYIIEMAPQAWRYGDSWYRQDVRRGLETLLNMEPVRTDPDQSTFLVWSRSVELMKPDIPLRTVPTEDVRLEVGMCWHWIVHVCSQAKRDQRSGKLMEGFHQWMRDTSTFVIPTSKIPLID